MLVLPLTARSQFVLSKRYSTVNGLFSDRITSITQDSQGYMWFGSYFGIERYDGYSFKHLQLPQEIQNKYVSVLLPVGDKLYAGFWFGGGLLQVEGDKTTLYKNNLSSMYDNIYALKHLKGDSLVLVATNNRVFMFFNGKFSSLFSIDPRSEIRSVEIENNAIWVATTLGLYYYNLVTREQKVFFSAQQVFCFSTMNGRRNLAGLVQDGVYKYFLFNKQDTSFLHPEFLFSASAFVPVHFSSGNSGFWTLQYKNRLVNISSEGKLSTYLLDGINEGDIRNMFLDREMNIWISNDPGVVKAFNFETTAYHFSETAPTSGYILPVQNSVLITNAKKIYQVKNDSFIQISAVHPERYTSMFHMDRNKQIWMSLWDSGLYKLNGSDSEIRSMEEIRYKQKKIICVGMVEDDENNTWIAGGESGVPLLKNGKIVEIFKLPQYANIIALAINKRKGILYLGENSSGVIRVKYKRSGAYFTYSVIDTINKENNLSDTYVRCLMLDSKERLWVGTRNGGLFRIDEDAGKPKAFSFGSQMKCSRISFITEYRDGIWASTCNGIYKIANDKVEKYYSTAHGLLGNDVYHFAIHNDALWAVTAVGVSRINLSSREAASPRVTISEINILGISDSSLAGVSNPAISYQKNSIGFVFTANSFIEETEVRYKYRLLGFDEKWSEPTATNSINYASLQPGSYNFQVIAQNGKGNWSEVASEYKFRIIRPFYHSAWFWILLFFVVISALYLVRSYRLKQKVKLERMRLDIARDLHDDIGSALGSINILTETAQRRLMQQQPGSTDILKKISSTAMETLESMDDIVWTINPQRDKSSDLFLRMREYAQPLMEAREVQFSFSAVNEEACKLEMRFRRNLFLFFKESINNILKHANATSVSVSIQMQNKKLHLVITDNGIGFSGNGKPGRNGLENLKRRAEFLDGDVLIASDKGKGTSIQLNCTLK